MEGGDGVGNRPICPLELANIAFVWFALPRRLQALKSQGIVDHYHRCVSINFYGCIVDNHAGLYEQHGWQLVSLKMHCPTWWTGIHTSVKSILRNWGALCVFKSTLIRDGYGYTAADEDEDSDASLDEDEDEEEDGDADGQAETQGTLLLAFDNTDTGQPGTVKSK